MGFKLDFSIIIAGLVLLQLYVLGMDVRKKNKKHKSRKMRNKEVVAETKATDVAVVEENAEVTLTVLRSNGEEKIYTKSNVA